MWLELGWEGVIVVVVGCVDYVFGVFFVFLYNLLLVEEFVVCVFLDIYICLLLCFEWLWLLWCFYCLCCLLYLVNM